MTIRHSKLKAIVLYLRRLTLIQVGQPHTCTQTEQTDRWQQTASLHRDESTTVIALRVDACTTCTLYLNLLYGLVGPVANGDIHFDRFTMVIRLEQEKKCKIKAYTHIHVQFTRTRKHTTTTNICLIIIILKNYT